MLNKAKKYKLTNEILATYFKYASTNSFNSTSSRNRILKAVEKIIEHVENEIVDRINK